MYINKREYGVGTYVVRSSPWGLFHSARALCSDGVLRTTSRISTIADTFFSVPAAVTVWQDGKRKTVSGYITFETLAGLTTEYDGDPTTVKFVAVQYGKNSDALPRGAWRGTLAYDEREVESCVDCIMLAANGETDDDCKIEPLTRVPDGWHLIPCTSRDSDGECNSFFSWRACDTCENPLAGDRHNCTLMTIDRVLIQDVQS